jgi:hypothetical protein
MEGSEGSEVRSLYGLSRSEVVIQASECEEYLRRHKFTEPAFFEPPAKGKGGRHPKAAWRDLSVIISAYLLAHHAERHQPPAYDAAAEQIYKIATNKGIDANSLPQPGTLKNVISEIFKMNFDPAKRTLLIPESKNGSSQTIPLSISAVELLRAHPANHERFFPITANAFRPAWERVKERAGIEDLRFHDLRHEAISRFFEKSLSVPEVSLISGHRDLRMLLRYTHPMTDGILRKLDS